MSDIIITQKNKAIEYDDCNGSLKLIIEKYITEELGFGKNFSLSAADWETIHNKQKSKTDIIELFNSLCKKQSDRIQKIVKDTDSSYPYTGSLGGTICRVCNNNYAEIINCNDFYYISTENPGLIITNQYFDNLPIKYISSSAFRNRRFLRYIHIANETITSIGRDAFYDCTNVVQVTLPENLNIIEARSFYNCTALSEIIIPASIDRIDVDAFACCYNLKNIYYTGSKTQWLRIKIMEGNDCLQKATITYNYAYDQT
jgi:hypothetical protein